MMEKALSNRRTQVAHLLRRAGFGSRIADIEVYTQLTHEQAVDRLLEATIDTNYTFGLERKLQQSNFAPNLAEIQYWWMLTMLRTPQPLQEKMTLFWHSHFATQRSKVESSYYMVRQNMFLRENALGNFRTLVEGIARDPAMLIFLDGRFNYKGKPNENFARELMELFTIGIGNYTEQDVRESARAFTGWNLRGDVFYYDPNRHDESQKTFLGHTGNLNGTDIINILFEKPETARFIVRKLWRFLISETPYEESVERLAEIFVSNNYELRPLLSAMLTSPEFLDESAYRALIKSPAELVVGTLRALGAQRLDNNALESMGRMGQALYQPPDVEGWQGGRLWINSTQLFERFNFLGTVTAARPGANYAIDPLSMIIERQLHSADEIVHFFNNILLDGQLSEPVYAGLLDYLTAGPKITAHSLAAARNLKTNDDKALDARIRGTIHLMVSLPEYQLN